MSDAVARTETNEVVDIPVVDTPVVRLTPKREAFCNEILADNNATQAAIRAGFSPASAGVTGSQLLKEPSVAARIAKLKADRVRRLGITADQVMNEFQLLAEANVDWFEVDVTGKIQLTAIAPEGAMRAIKSVSRKEHYDKEGRLCIDVKFELWDKPGQLKVMGRHAGFTAVNEKVEVTGKDGAPIELALVGATTATLKDELARLSKDIEALDE